MKPVNSVAVSGTEEIMFVTEQVRTTMSHFNKRAMTTSQHKQNFRVTV